MEQKIWNLWRRATRGRVAQHEGLALMVPCSAVVSLAYAGYSPAGLNAGTTDKHPVIVASGAVSKRVYSGSVPQASVADVVTKALAFQGIADNGATGHP
jgi:hypothetical protein